MQRYESMYFKLAAKMADAIETLDKVSRDLKIAQFETEEMYMDSGDEDTVNVELHLLEK